MRIDQLLNKLCLIKTRSIAKRACDKNLVKINNKIAKSSSKVYEGDIVEFQIFGHFNKVKILEIPKGNISKKNTPDFYKVLEKRNAKIE